MCMYYVRSARSELAQTAKEYRTGKQYGAKGAVPLKHKYKHEEIPVGNEVVGAHMGESKKEKRRQEEAAEDSYGGLQSSGYHAYKNFLIEKAKKELHRKGLPSKDEDAIRFLSSKEMMERATMGDIIDTHRLGTTGKTPEARPSRVGLWDKPVPPSA
jgi:hypothetical protein